MRLLVSHAPLFTRTVSDTVALLQPITKRHACTPSQRLNRNNMANRYDYDKTTLNANDSSITVGIKTGLLWFGAPIPDTTTY